MLSLGITGVASAVAAAAVLAAGAFGLVAAAVSAALEFFVVDLVALAYFFKVSAFTGVAGFLAGVGGFLAGASVFFTGGVFALVKLPLVFELAVAGDLAIVLLSILVFDTYFFISTPFDFVVALEIFLVSAALLTVTLSFLGSITFVVVVAAFFYSFVSVTFLPIFEKILII